jgi:hypothetical protein
VPARGFYGQLWVLSMQTLLPQQIGWVGVQTFDGGQLTLVPEQLTCAVQKSGSLSRQTVPLGLRASGGHAVLLPSQVSTASHPPAAGRHTVEDGCTPSGGHVVPPLHVSAASHTSTAERHTTLDG